MALLRAPVTLGEVIALRGARDATLAVHAPDGLELRIPAPTGRVALWLPQAGVWRYQWDGGPVEELTVIEGDAPHVPAPRTAPAAAASSGPGYIG